MAANRFIFLALLTAIVGAAGAVADEQRAQEARRAAVAPDAEERNKLDLNTADVNALAAVPVIGPDLAPVIVAARPFATLHDLDRLRGINAERLEQIRASVKVSSPAAAMPRDPLGFPLKGERPRSTDRTDSFGLPKAPEIPVAPDEPLRIDVNTADAKTLQALPGVGPELARAIIAGRPFETLEGLNRVRGINTEHLALLKARLIVIPATIAPPKEEAPASRAR